MSAPVLKAADLTQERLLRLVASLGLPATDGEMPRIWLEAPDGWCFDWWRGMSHSIRWCGAGREPIEVEEGVDKYFIRSTSGRLFTPSGELRWRMIPILGNACWRTVFLGDVDWVGSGLDDCSDLLIGLRPERHRYFLWGEQTAATPGEWIELRIPHRFRYPVSNNARNVAAIVEQWRDEKGEPHFLRLCDIQPLVEENDASR